MPNPLSSIFIGESDTMKQYSPADREYKDFYPKTKIDKIIDYKENIVNYEVSDTDESTAFSKDVPENVMGFIRIQKLSGKTIIWNQKFNIASVSAASSNNINLVNYSDYLLLNGTSDANGSIQLLSVSLVKDHKYVFSGFPTNTSSEGFSIKVNNTVLNLQDISGAGGCAIWTPTLSSSFGIYFDFSSNVTINQQFFPQIHDLTLMFGSGQEPSLQDFIEIFGTSNSYSNSELFSFKPLILRSFDTNNTLVSALEIPNILLTIPNYGDSVRGITNYLDFVNKRFVRQVKSRAYTSGDENNPLLLTDGVTTNYILSQPEYVDLSATISDEYFILVAPGGKVKFYTQDQLAPVQSTILFFVGIKGILTPEDKFKLDHFSGFFDMDENGDLMPK